MTELEKAARQALEALERYSGVDQRACDAEEALRAALAEPVQEPLNKYCCHSCFKKSGQFFLDRMILCPECGNKRCPKATHHELPCTNSNEPGQPGSIYTSPPASKPWVVLTDEEIAVIASTPCAVVGSYVHTFARAIEAKLREKNA